MHAPACPRSATSEAGREWSPDRARDLRCTLARQFFGIEGRAAEGQSGGDEERSRAHLRAIREARAHADTNRAIDHSDDAM